MRATSLHEQFFECVFAADQNEYRFHFRAWTPEEAVYHLRRELADHRVAMRGELRVLDAHGGVAIREAYDPVGGAGRSRPS